MRLLKPSISIVSTAPARRKNGKPGRKTKFTPELSRRILRLISKGIPVSHATRACGITFQSFRNFQQAYPDFEDKCRNALSAGIRRRVEIVEKCCRSQDEGLRLRAAQWWLTHIPGAAEYFSETRKIELSGELDGRVAVLVWPHHAPKDITNESNDSITRAP